MPPFPATKLELIEKLNITVDQSPEDVKVQIQTLLERGEMRLKDIERATGYKSTAISLHLKGKYEGDMDDALVRFYRSWVAKWTIVRTKVVEEIQVVMELTWKRREIGMIVARFGRGKTKAAQLYCAVHPDYSRFIELSGASSPAELINKIAEALDISDLLQGSISNKLQAIIRALERKPKLIVVDEADELKPKSLKLIRDIHGDNQERCAIVLIATDRLLKLLQNNELGYLRRSITIKRRVEDIDFDEAKEIADRYPHDLDKGELKQAWDWSKKKDGIASLVNLMRRGYDLMLMRDLKEIDSDTLKEAYSWLIG
jgi:DNA transposition AAA+ family ATPase